MNLLGLRSQVKRMAHSSGSALRGRPRGDCSSADYVRAFPDQVAVLLSASSAPSPCSRRISPSPTHRSGLFGDGRCSCGGHRRRPAADRSVKRPRIVGQPVGLLPADSERVMGGTSPRRASRSSFRRTSPWCPGTSCVRRRLVPGIAWPQGLRPRLLGLPSGGPRYWKAMQESLDLPRWSRWT